MPEALAGYPAWRTGGSLRVMLPFDARIAVFPHGTRDEDALRLLSEAKLLRRFRFHDGPSALPDGLVLYLTRRCNGRCAYCEAAIGGETDDMELPVLNAAFELAAHIARRQEGPVSLTYLGGEPTLRPDLIEAMHRRLTLARVDAAAALCTNGMLSPDVRERLLRLPLKWRVSLDLPPEAGAGGMRAGIDPRAVTQTIRAAVSAGRRVVLRTTVGRHNLERMPDMLALCERLGCSHIVFTPLRVAYGRSVRVAAQAPDPAEYAAMWLRCKRAAPSLVRDSHWRMLFGARGLYCSSTFIMPGGEALPTICEAYGRERLRLGDVRRRDWAALARRSDALRADFLAAVDDRCGDCPARHICGGGFKATELRLGNRATRAECSVLRHLLAAVARSLDARLPGAAAEPFALFPYTESMMYEEV